VRVHVTQLETVFLYRFLQEVLGYISLTLALRPPPLQSRAGAAMTDRASAAASAALQAELQRGMGTVLQLDVSMEAPVIIMPRNSDSPDKARGAVLALPVQLSIICYALRCTVQPVASVNARALQTLCQTCFEKWLTAGIPGQFLKNSQAPSDGVCSQMREKYRLLDRWPGGLAD
jgi:hypothetical protein